MIILINVVAAVILKWYFTPTYPFSIIVVTILGCGVICMFLAKVRKQYCLQQTSARRMGLDMCIAEQLPGLLSCT